MPDAIYLQLNGTLHTHNKYKQGEAQTSGSPPRKNLTQLNDDRNLIGIYPAKQEPKRAPERNINNITEKDSYLKSSQLQLK